MILGRPLTAEERRKSQRLYGAFSFGNGMSYMCLGENLLVLFAVQLGAPNAVVALLGAMQFIGYAMLPLGVRHTARRGAATCQADFWVARNVAALLTASAALVWRVSPPAAWGLVLLGALLFYGFRAAGGVLFTPLMGDVSTEEEAQVAGSIAVNLAAGGGAGVVGSVLGAWLVSHSADWAPKLGVAFGGAPGPFRLYFLLLLPIAAATAVACLALRTKVYSYRREHGEEALRRAVALGHHRKH